MGVWIDQNVRPKDEAKRVSDAKAGIFDIKGSRGFGTLGGDIIVYTARCHLEYFAQVKDVQLSRIYVSVGVELSAVICGLVRNHFPNNGFEKRRENIYGPAKYLLRVKSGGRRNRNEDELGIEWNEGIIGVILTDKSGWK